MSRAATDLSAKRDGCLPDAGKSLDFNIVLPKKIFYVWIKQHVLLVLNEEEKRLKFNHSSK